MATLSKTVSAFDSAVSVETGIFARVVKAVKNYIVVNRTYNELSSLTDAQLRDIGIYRNDIEAVALGKK